MNKKPRFKIISGGQTGVDQAALKAAFDMGIEAGGWCPPGRVCESGKIPDEFPLRETEKECSEKAPDVPRSLRTELNVRDADAILILLPEKVKPDPGTHWTVECAKTLKKPFLIIDPYADNAVALVAAWLQANHIQTLNVAGPSEGQCPLIFAKSYELIRKVLTQVS